MMNIYEESTPNFWICLFWFVTKKKKTISKCQEDKNVTQETKQKLINQTHVHMKYNIRHDVCNVSKIHRKKKYINA